MIESNESVPEPNENQPGRGTEGDQLDRLAEQINQHTDHLMAGVRTTVEAAREIGLRLIEVRRLLKGAGTPFKGWVGENCRFSYISACRYVRLAEHWDRFTDHQRGTFSIPELLDQVAGHRRVRDDHRQPEGEQGVAANAVSSAGPQACPNAAAPVDQGGGVAEAAPDAVQPHQPHAPVAGAGQITVTHAQVRQAAAKHGLDAVLDQVSAERMIAFLAELGVKVAEDEAPEGRTPSPRVARPTGTGGERGRLFFSYYGGKHLRGGRYPAPAHRLIIEPFAGSAGYATRYRDREVRLYDVYERVVGTWAYLIRATASEIKALPADVEHLGYHPGLVQEAQWLIGFWLNKGCTTPRKRKSGWMPGHDSPGCYWGERVRDRLAVQVESIRHWRVYQQSHHEIPDERATWFVDPPYQGKAGSYYTHKFTDHERLAEWCRARTGQVIVCEHKGAGWLPFQPLGPTSPRYVREVVWCCAG